MAGIPGIAGQASRARDPVTLVGAVACIPNSMGLFGIQAGIQEVIFRHKKTGSVAGFSVLQVLVETCRYCYMVPEGDSNFGL